jgi:hypothetical protein
MCSNGGAAAGAVTFTTTICYDPAMQTPSSDDLALNRCITIGASVGCLIFVLAMLTALGWWKLIAVAIWAYAFIALVILPFYRSYVERPIYDEGPSNIDLSLECSGTTCGEKRVAIDTKLRERLAIRACDRPTPVSELWIVSLALPVVREIVSLAQAVVRWMVLLLFCYPMQHPSGHRGWLRETAFVAAIVTAVIAGAMLRHLIER